MSSKKVRVGIVGVGKMGGHHLTKYLSMPDVEVVGFYETNAERARELSQKHCIPACSTLAELLFEADAISVASPTPTHFPIVKQAFDAGVDVLVEKPICETVQQAQQLVAMAAEKQLLLQVGFLERFRFMGLSSELFFGGAVRFIESHRLSPSLSREGTIDVVSDLMIHDLDLILSLVGEQPSHISAIAVPVLTSKYDIANVRLEFPSGAVANLNASRVSSRPERKLRVFTNRSYISMDFLSNGVTIASKNHLHQIEHKSFNRTEMDALKDQCAAFLSCVRERRPPLVSGVDGLNALRILEQIKDKIEHRTRLQSPRRPTDLRVD